MTFNSTEFTCEDSASQLSRLFIKLSVGRPPQNRELHACCVYSKSPTFKTLCFAGGVVWLTWAVVSRFYRLCAAASFLAACVWADDFLRASPAACKRGRSFPPQRLPSLSFESIFGMSIMSYRFKAQPYRRKLYATKRKRLITRTKTKSKLKSHRAPRHVLH